jgi:hypothetical protein
LNPAGFFHEDDHFLKITNFTQEGGVDRGVVIVTLEGDTNATATVLAATRIDLVLELIRSILRKLVTAS